MTDVGPCTLWTGRIRDDGYGTIGVDLAHRRAWEDSVGPIPDGLELDHLCGTRACIRIDHLEPVTRAENIARSDVGGPNRRKTHCPRGHPYAGDNLLVSGGGRLCRADERLELLLELDGDESPEADAVRRLLELDRAHVRRELTILGRSTTPLTDRIVATKLADPSLEAAFVQALEAAEEVAS